MRKFLSILLLALVSPAFAGPREVVAACVADAKNLSGDAAGYTRYFDFTDGVKGMDLQTADFHNNSLSRRGDFVHLTEVTPGIYRLDIRDVGWGKETWEKLVEFEPYFHDQAHVIEADAYEEYGHYYDQQNKEVSLEEGKRRKDCHWVTTRKEKKSVAHKVAPAGVWTGEQNAALLYELTHSEVPVVRMDWFFAQTAIEFGREGAGYYEFLGLKSRDDVFDLCGLDVDRSRKLYQEIAAIVLDSGVALNNRQIFGERGTTGRMWRSLDAKKSTGKNNAIRLLDKDFKHDAEEIYFFLPNGLFGTFASDDKGVLQITVPDTIASDKRSTSNDGRIHPGLSCIRCHEAGLKPIDDWARSFYSQGGDTNLRSPDHEAFLQLKSTYLGDLETKLKRDVEDYSEALKRLNGRTPEEQSKAYAEAWTAYEETPVTGEEFAHELGVTRLQMVIAFHNYNKANGSIDPVLNNCLKITEIPNRREQIEEIYPVAQRILLGVSP